MSRPAASATPPPAGEPAGVRLIDLDGAARARRRLVEVMTRLRGDGGRLMGLLLVRLHKLRNVRVTYGEAALRDLLDSVHQRLAAVAGQRDLMLRLSEGELALVVNGLRFEEQLGFALEKAERLLAQSFAIAELAIKLDFTIGAAVAPGAAVSAGELLRRSEVALLHARGEGRRTGCFREAADVRRHTSRLELVAELEEALYRNELQIVFQPKTVLETGELAGVEALSRWQSAKQGFVPPDVFIEVAEQSGLITDLTLWSIRQAGIHYHAWRQQGLTIPIAINLSPVALHHPELIPQLVNVTRIWDMPPEHITLEITETAAMTHPERNLAAFRNLVDMGIRLAMDDFGTGYSSMEYLKNFPLSELKIDKSFVQQMSSDISDRKIVRSMVDMACNFDLQVVAEGIEDREIYELARNLGCRYAQGYFIARPMPADELVAWARAGTWYRPGR